MVAGTTPSKASNITWSHSAVTAEARQRLLGHSGLTVWLTGLSGSGKSTLATAAESALITRGVLACVVDGANLRFGLNSDLGFSPEDRAENIRRAGELCAVLCQTGLVVLASFISPYRADRDRVRSRHEAGSFVEVFVDAPLEVCEQRDPKGLYASARAGDITNLTGVSAPYETPVNPELHINTAAMEPGDAAKRLVDSVLKRVKR